MTIYFCDLEADGLLEDVNNIHCLTVKPYGKYTKTYIQGITAFFDSLIGQDTLVFHNGSGYDLPALVKLGYIDDYSVQPDWIQVQGKKVDVQLIDTLALSRYWWPDNPYGHGLFGWAERLNGVKPVVEDWKDQPIEVYIERCEADVVLTEQVFKFLAEKLEISYE